MMAKKKTVVLYPGFGVGHLTPMLELAKVFLRHAGDALDVAVALAEPPIMNAGFHAAVARAQAANPSVSFHILPTPSSSSAAGEPEEPLVTIMRFLRATNAPLRSFLRSHSPPAAALILDMFCADALDVAAELALPAYFLFPSGAAGLAVFLALPAARAAIGGAGGFGSLGAGAVLTFHGAPPMRVSELSQGLAEDGESCRAMLRVAARMPEGARGILVSSLEKLEPRAMEALRDGRCLPDRPTPPVYCVGPLVSPGGAAAADDRHECLRWMDAQPDRSVVFLCFGSMGAFPKHQLAEIAAGLESSGQRFLWVVRSPHPPGAAAAGGEKSDESLDALLPAGFMERTEGRGLVVNSWAPQVDVLRHRAASAFVTHCGWNSTLEGVAAGVPLLCWPLYAEQKMNKVRIVEDMRLGVGMEMDGEGFVKAEEVEKKVRWVMEGDDGEVRELRKRVAKAKELAAEAVEEGGPSDLAFVEFLKDLFEASQQGLVHV
ncbi:unnamed protein product [Urochloa decumbens]|uniref:Glycosyltransferase n=1 Tax=Urochloa decumbens TaxID=240449 RepID=A0ABC8VXJ8_9POAL